MRRLLMTGLATTAALAAFSAAAPVAAQPYGYYSDGRDPCQQKQHNNGTAGALIGGAAGAALGNSVSRGGGRTGGTIIGGVAGAVIGNNIGRSSAKGSDTCRYSDEPPPPPPSSYYSPGYDPRYGYNNRYQQPYGQPYYGQPYSSQPGYGRDDDDDDDGY